MREKNFKTEAHTRWHVQEFGVKHPMRPVEVEVAPEVEQYQCLRNRPASDFFCQTRPSSPSDVQHAPGCQVIDSQVVKAAN